MLTLAQAKKLNRMSVSTTARWYKQGYYMRADGLWYITVGSKEYVKYYTGAQGLYKLVDTLAIVRYN